jgi:hypothetical protein
MPHVYGKGHAICLVTWIPSNFQKLPHRKIFIVMDLPRHENCMHTTINLTIRFHHYNTHLYHIQVQCCCHNNFAMSTKFATTINPCWNTLKFPTFVCFFQGKVQIVMQRQLASLQ